MRPHRALLALAIVALSASCSSSTDASPAGNIVGNWVADSAASPPGSYVRRLTFTQQGTFVLDFQSHGLYENQQADDLSGYERTTGTFTVNGDRVSFEPSQLVVWDYSFGRDAQPTVYAPYPYDHFYDDAHFHVGDDALTLDFTTYPADAPEPARQIFRRDS